MIGKEKESSGQKPALYLGYSVQELERVGAIHTAKEISMQPQLWKDTWSHIAEQRSSLENFLAKSYSSNDLDIILTGAGTSAFIGNILEGLYKKNSGKRTRAIATTDLVTHPEIYFHPEVPTLLISFARSGNSPESVATVNLADKFCKNVQHLIITCNATGELATIESPNEVLVFLLPPEANDQSLAMTGSFSSMLLAGLLISRLHQTRELEIQVSLLAKYGDRILNNYTDRLREVAGYHFKRAVFLGSGPLHGTARESGLKLQELTDGKIICIDDSFLGFRHGPKAVIDEETLLVYLFSNARYVHRYELDLINSINDGEKGLYRIGIIESAENEATTNVDLMLELSPDHEKLDEEFLTVCSVLPAQILGFFKCLDLNLRPDQPSEKNTITRVVEGVNIYPLFPQFNDEKSLVTENNLIL
jgi:tagatose-6-phosphate ketose/aldose isomerase